MVPETTNTSTPNLLYLFAIAMRSNKQNATQAIDSFRYRNGGKGVLVRNGGVGV